MPTDDTAIITKLAAVEQLILSVQRDLGRLEIAETRTNDNVDSTRHALNNSVQKALSSIEIMADVIKDLTRDLKPMIATAASAHTLGLQTQGGIKVARWLWPVIVALGVAAGLGGGVYWGH